MKKKETNAFLHSRWVKKLLLTMKLTIVLLLLGLMQVSATVYSQATKFNLKLEKQQVADVLKEIEENSNFRFFYLREQVDVEKVISINSNENTVEEILTAIFKDEGINYKVLENDLILISPEKIGFSNLLDVAQQKSVTGKVTDETGQPLPGVTVKVKGTTRGTVTDVDGNYSMSNVPDDATLVFSFIGMKTQEMPASGVTNINVTLDNLIIGVDEVVVVGYGSQKRANITGSVTQIESDIIDGRPVTSASQVIQGVVPGVFAAQGYSAPGRDETRIRIRGVSLQIAGGTSDPLILIDGIQGSINNINPSDIESVTVLKDAASTAIYGSQAANGVILVTTKRGSVGKVIVRYEGYGGFQRGTRLPEPVSNSAQWMDLVNQGYINGGKAQLYPDETVEAYRSNPNLPNTNWLDLLYRDAPIQNHNIQVNGGGEATNFFLSANYLNQEGIQLGTNTERFNIRLNLDTKISDRFTAGLNFSASSQKRHDQGSSQTAIFLQALAANPITDHVISADGRYSMPALGISGGERSNRNPMGVVDNNLYDATFRNFNAAVFGELKITEGLKLKAQASYRLNSTNSKTFLRGYETFKKNVVEDPNTGGLVWNSDVPENTDHLVIGKQNGGINTLSRSTNETDYYNIFSHLDYQKKIGEHNVTVLLGVQQEWITGTGFNASIKNGYPYPIEEFSGGSADPLDQTVGRGQPPVEWMLRSGFSRVNYSFKERYLFEANFRIDASSKFHPDYRIGYFPSFSAGWRISEEPFLQKIDFLSNLKLRASWGRSGEQRGINAYAYISSIANAGDYVFGSGTSVTSGKAISSLAAADVKWQTNQQWDIGLEAGFFDGKLSFETDYFVKDNLDQLARLQLVSLAGVGAPIGNPFSVRNQGVEIKIDHQNNIRKLQYNIGVNLSMVKNEVLELGGDTIYSGRTITAEGLPLRSLYLYQVEGIVQTQEEADALNQGAPDGTYQSGGNALLKPGDLKYKDLNGDNQVTADDRAVTSKPYPGLIFGINLGARYRNFDLAILAQGILDYDVFVLGWGLDPLQQNSLTTYWVDHWTPENTSSNKPMLKTPLGGANNNNRPGAYPSTFYTFDGSYLRAKNIQLGYTLPSSITKKVLLSNIRIFVNVQNAFVITKFVDGFDPERLTTTDPGDANVRAAQYPQAKTFTAGLNVKF
ncbi:MAG: TonB-dependent receptor [Bacteroidota bacterium]